MFLVCTSADGEYELILMNIIDIINKTEPDILSTLQINGARLFNMPMSIRRIKTHKDQFKEALDLYLITVADQPKIGSLVPAAVTDDMKTLSQSPGRESSILGQLCLVVSTDKARTVTLLV